MKQGRPDRKLPESSKPEPNPQIKSPAGVSYMGNMKGNHTMGGGDIDNVRYPNIDLGNGFNPSGPVKSFNAVGPGAGRTVRKSGTQGSY